MNDISTQKGNVGWVLHWGLLWPASLHVIPSLDTLSVGVWGTLKELKDDDLRRLAGGLPTSVLRCRATSSTNGSL